MPHTNRSWQRMSSKEIIFTSIVVVACGYWAGQRHAQSSSHVKQSLERVQKEFDNIKHLHFLRSQALQKKKDVLQQKQSQLLTLYHRIQELPTFHLGVNASESTRVGSIDKPILIPFRTQKSKANDVITMSKYPHLRQCTPPAESKANLPTLPVYVFICGVEGAGHHAMEAVLRQVNKSVNLALVGYNPGLHSFSKHKNVSRAYQFPSIDYGAYSRGMKYYLEKSASAAGKFLVVDSRNSYPEGFGCGSLAHPDLVFLSKMDGKIVDLRVIVIYRDPTATVLSSVRRFQVENFTYKNYQYQARNVQESLTIINNGLSFVPCGKSLRVSYEELLDVPSSYVEPLSRIFGIQQNIMEEAMLQLKKPTSRSSAQTDHIKQHLHTFFEAQKKLWPVISGETQWAPLNLPNRTIPVSILREHSICK